MKTLVASFSIYLTHPIIDDDATVDELVTKAVSRFVDDSFYEDGCLSVWYVIEYTPPVIITRSDAGAYTKPGDDVEALAYDILDDIKKALLANGFNIQRVDINRGECDSFDIEPIPDYDLTY